MQEQEINTQEQEITNQYFLFSVNKRILGFTRSGLRKKISFRKENISYQKRGGWMNINKQLTKTKKSIRPVGCN